MIKGELKGKTKIQRKTARVAKKWQKSDSHRLNGN